MMAATACELKWINISISIGAVAIVVSVLFSVLLLVSSALRRRQQLLVLTLRRQLEAARMNQTTNNSQVQPPHPTNHQCQHSSLCISEEHVYADVVQDDNIAMTSENVAYEQTSGNVVTTDNVAYEQSSGNVMTTDNVAYEQTSGNVTTTENVACEQNSGMALSTENMAHGHCGVPLHDKPPDEPGTTPQEAKQAIEDEEDYI